MSYSYDIFDSSWKKIGSKDLEASLFEERAMSDSVLHEYVVMYLANQRQSTAHTKTRSEITWSWRKLYRQKWTWNARVGNAASPIRRKWGVVFWPRNERNYSKSMNKKMKKSALLTAVWLKLKSSSVFWLDSFSLDEIKTSKISTLISDIWLSNKSLLVVWESQNEIFYKSSRNISKVTYVSADNVNPYDLVTHSWVLFMDWACDVLLNRIKK